MKKEFLDELYDLRFRIVKDIERLEGINGQAKT